MSVNTARLAVTGIREIGLEIPAKGRTEFISAPLNITKATLKPTEYTRLSIVPMLWIRRILRIRMPGMKVRKLKPTICLKPGTSKPKLASPISPSVSNRRTSDKSRHFLTSQSLGGVTRRPFFHRSLSTETCCLLGIVYHLKRLISRSRKGHQAGIWQSRMPFGVNTSRRKRLALNLMRIDPLWYTFATYCSGLLKSY